MKLRSRAMPPPGSRRPDNATYDAVAAWLEAELDRAAAPQPESGPARRTCIASIAPNTPTRFAICWAWRSIRRRMLPPDAQAHGFDTNADALSMEPALLDRYLTAAAKIARLAVGDPTLPPAVERYTAVKGNSNEQTWLWQTDRLGEDFPLGSRGGIAARHYFPVDGEYVLKVRLAQDLRRRHPRPERAERDRDSRRRRARRPVHDRRPRRHRGQPGRRRHPLQVRVPLKAGLRQVVATIVKSER